jgi:hypothetical protein
MPRPRNAYTDAVDELAAESRNRPHDHTVTIDDARKAVDAEVIHVWSMMQLKSRSPQRLLLDAFEGLTDAQAVDAWVHLPHAYKDNARAVLAAAQLEYVAKDLQHDAQKQVDEFDPTDAEMAGGITPNDIDDPFLSERRSFTRNHNASLSGWRRV